MKISFFFAWFDMWIGAYWNQVSHTLYICPLPMCVIKIQPNLKKYKGCTAHVNPGFRLVKPGKMCGCGNPLDIPQAVDIGDGWALMWSCRENCGEWDDYTIDWPFVEPAANGHDFEAIGFEVL